MMEGCLKACLGDGLMLNSDPPNQMLYTLAFKHTSSIPVSNMDFLSFLQEFIHAVM